MYNYIFYILLSFVILEFAVGMVLDRLNKKSMSLPVPDLLRDIYDNAEYGKQQAYVKENRKAERVEKILKFGVVLVVLFSGLLGVIDTWCRSVAGESLWSFLIFFGIIMLFLMIFSLPFSYYSTFVIEEKYGFNKTTKKVFWTDFLKGFCISAVLAGVVLSVIYLLYEELGRDFWIYALMVVVVIYIFFSLFYSHIIVPLFNKQIPLGEGELRDAINVFAEKTGFSIKNIYVINGSKHSTKANAYFTGFGTMKRVVLYDTLIEQLTTDEIVAVLAHEIGHYKHYDTLRSLFLTLLYIAVNFYIFSILAAHPDLSQALGGTGTSFALSLVAFNMLYTPIDMMISPVLNAISQRAEYGADSFASAHGYGKHLIAGLKKLTANTLTPLTYHPLYVIFYFSHPTLLESIKNIMGKE